MKACAPTSSTKARPMMRKASHTSDHTLDDDLSLDFWVIDSTDTAKWVEHHRYFAANLVQRDGYLVLIKAVRAGICRVGAVIAHDKHVVLGHRDVTEIWTAASL